MAAIILAFAIAIIGSRKEPEEAEQLPPLPTYSSKNNMPKALDWLLIILFFHG